MAGVTLHRTMAPFGGHQATRICVICGLVFEPEYAQGCGRLESGEWVCSAECRATACYDYRDECAGA